MCLRIYTGCFLGIPSESTLVGQTKKCFPWLRGTYRTFCPHPFTWKTPTPPKDLRTQKFGFVLFFLPETKHFGEQFGWLVTCTRATESQNYNHLLLQWLLPLLLLLLILPLLLLLLPLLLHLLEPFPHQPANALQLVLVQVPLDLCSQGIASLLCPSQVPLAWVGL